jgi:outer membrane lipoprotein SlyB
MSQQQITTEHSVDRGRFRAGVRKVFAQHPLGTGFGSTLGAALVSAAAGAAGVGTIGVYTSVATGVVIGGWAGHAISKRRSKHVDADVLRRRTRTMRLLKVTRMLQRRKVA